MSDLQSLDDGTPSFKSIIDEHVQRLKIERNESTTSKQQLSLDREKAIYEEGIKLFNQDKDGLFDACVEQNPNYVAKGNEGDISLYSHILPFKYAKIFKNNNDIYLFTVLSKNGTHEEENDYRDQLKTIKNLEYVKAFDKIKEINKKGQILKNLRKPNLFVVIFCDFINESEQVEEDLKSLKKEDKNLITELKPQDFNVVNTMIFDSYKFDQLLKLVKFKVNSAKLFLKKTQVSNQYQIKTGAFEEYFLPINANDLQNFYAQYHDSSFNDNVRVYLGKKPVNKKIEQSILGTNKVLDKKDKKTLLNHAELNKNTFMSKSNGLYLITDNVIKDQDGKITILDGCSVINGGQTLATLYFTFKKLATHKHQDIKDIAIDMFNFNVPCYILVIPKTHPHYHEYCQKISLRSNTQSKIQTSDLKSSAPLWLKFEGIFVEKKYTHFYFERIKGALNVKKLQGQFKSLKKDQVISPKDIASILFSKYQMPFMSIKGKEECMKHFSADGQDVVANGITIPVRSVTDFQGLFNEMIAVWRLQKALAKNLKAYSVSNPGTIRHADAFEATAWYFIALLYRDSVMSSITIPESLDIIDLFDRSALENALVELYQYLVQITGGTGAYRDRLRDISIWNQCKTDLDKNHHITTNILK